MKTTRSFLPLIRFNLITLPWPVWFMVGINLLMAADTVRYRSGYSSLELPLNLSLTLIFPMLIGVQFFTSGKDRQVLANAEFLVTRPISRGDAWRARMVLYFTLTLLAPLLAVCFSMHSLDLRFWLSSSKTRQAETAGTLALYQGAFPDAHTEGRDEDSGGTLVIPRGNVLMAAWNFFAVLLFTLAMQISILIWISSKFLGKIIIMLPPLLLMGATIYSNYIHSDIMAESAFFFFARHCIAIALLVFAIAGAIQYFAWKRIAELEII